MKGVILAAGQGTRIKNVTYGAFPKELLPIGNVPTIRFPIESLKLVGIKDLFIVISPNGKQSIVEGLKSGRQFSVNICYIVQEREEGEPSGIGKAILSAENWIEQEDFVVACGDTILCDFSSRNPFNCLSPVLKVHNSNNPLATIVLYPTNVDPTRFGVAKFQELKNESGKMFGPLERLVEKPTEEIARELMYNNSNYVIAGYYLFKPEIFSYIKKTNPDPKNEVQITNSLIQAMENGEKVYGVVHGGSQGNKMRPYEYWDVGIPEAYKEANRRLLDTDLGEILS